MTIKQFTDAELFTMFNVELPDGDDLWTVRFRRQGKVVDPSAMDVDELRRARRQERAERVEKLAELVGSMDAKKMEADDVSITDLINKPKFV